MAGLHEASKNTHSRDYRYNCPCSPGSPQNSTLQSFIGNDYYCKSGNSASDGTWQYILYTTIHCGMVKTAVVKVLAVQLLHGLPWFHKVLNTTTTDYLELRVCGDQETTNDDVPVSFYELYVK